MGVGDRNWRTRTPAIQMHEGHFSEASGTARRDCKVELEGAHHGKCSPYPVVTRTARGSIVSALERANRWMQSCAHLGSRLEKRIGAGRVLLGVTSASCVWTQLPTPEALLSPGLPLYSSRSTKTLQDHQTDRQRRDARVQRGHTTLVEACGSSLSGRQMTLSGIVCRSDSLRFVERFRPLFRAPSEFAGCRCDC